MAGRRISISARTLFPVYCDHCLARYDVQALNLAGAREQAAERWAWIVSPSGHDLCRQCVKNGIHKAAPYNLKPKK